MLNGGTIEQVGSPMELVNAPATPFVASPIGSPKMTDREGKLARDVGCQTYGIRPEPVILRDEGGRVG